jgi:hypothetical protein
MSEPSIPDEKTILKYMQLQQELQDAYTQQALGYMTAMTEVVPMVSAGKGLLKSAQAMAKPDVFGMRPTARITNEPLLIADQYEEARRLSDEFLLDDLDDEQHALGIFADAADRQSDEEFYRLGGASPNNPFLYEELQELELLIQNNHGSDAFLPDGSLDFDYLKREEGIDLDKPLNEWNEERYLNDYDNLHTALLGSQRQDPFMLKQTFDRMPQLMTGRRYATNVRFEDQLAEAMEQQMINQRLNDPKRRAYFDSLPEYIKRSNFNEDVGF